MLRVLFLAAASLAGDAFQEKIIEQGESQRPAIEPLRSTAIGIPGDPWNVITTRRLTGGKQEGVTTVEINNGRLRILVVPTRGMGIWQVVDGSTRIGWDSPVKEIVHPSFVSLTSRGGLGWLEGFGEFLCRCGLENNGHPGKDTIKDNTGAESSTELTLHGKQAYLPAELVEVSVLHKPPYTISLRGVVPERMMHGPKLRLETVITTDIGSNRFAVKDVIVNESAVETEYQILYHTNFGAPLLEEGSQCLAPIQQVVPFNERAAEGDLRQFAHFAGPVAGFVEQVYCVELFADENQKTLVALANRAKDRAVSLRYTVDQLPYLTLWKNTAAKEDGYVTGIEPGTNYPYNRNLERIAGRVPKLPPHGRREIQIEFGFHQGSDEVGAISREVEAIQKGRSTNFVPSPRRPGTETSP